ncbi:family 78 glycoside hydrolase catalytic domain [Herbiconiux sp. A18JL235]|uniref:alpha-L-rhamnosidase n=1 Tax=Herbiconiux sp. A18JL235 TaxID=3152363 RepID=A0AB39BHP8_9MICO
MTDGQVAFSLLCDQLVEPTGVAGAVWLSWSLSNAADSAPEAVRVRVWRDGTRSAVDAWESEWMTPLTAGIRHGEDSLISNTRYAWSVEVRSSDGSSTRTSSVFLTGLVGAGRWQAQWIASGPQSVVRADPPSDDGLSYAVRYLPPTPYFRHEFTVRRDLERAVVHVTARGVYELFANGERVGDRELEPGWTDYSDRVEYQTYDITDALRVGPNAFGATVAAGWWHGYVGFDRRRQAEHYGAEPELLVQAHLCYSDGSEDVVASGEGWASSEGPIRFADLLMGQYVDDRVDLGDWTLPGGADSSWVPVRARDIGSSIPTSTPRPPIRAIEHRAGRIVHSEPDRILVDFGQNLVGRLNVTVSSLERGGSITIRHGETITPEGDLYVDNLRTAEATDRFVSSGRSATFAPTFTSHGFRFAELIGDVAALTDRDIEAVSVRSDNREVGTLTLNDEGLDQLHSNIVWGLRSNMVSIPTDCPQRDERLGWLADAQVFLPSAAYNANVSAFLTSWLRDVRYTQDDDGAFADVAPRLRLPQQAAPGWGDAGVIVPWTLYRLYGDIRVLQDSFESMLAWIGHIDRHNPDHLWRHAAGLNYGDWLGVEEETDRELLATAYFARSLELTAAAADVLHATSEAARLRALRLEVVDAFRREFLDSSTGVLRSDTQTAYCLALAFDLINPGELPLVASRLVDAVERRGPALTTGFIGVALLLPTLSLIGRSDLAWALARRREYPSWLYSVDHGATTIWERWDGWTTTDGFQSAQMNSFNHYSLGSIDEWFYAYAAGIRQSRNSLAFADLEMEPAVDAAVGHVAASFESPRGLIRSEWSYDGSTLEWDIELPPSCSATIVLAVSPRERVLLNGVELTLTAVETEPPLAAPLAGASPRYRWRVDPGRHRVTRLVT